MNYCETLRCAELCTGKTCQKCSLKKLCFIVEDPDTAKSMVILAVIAARASKTDVFLFIDPDIQKKLDWLEAYLCLAFGTCNWYLRFHIRSTARMQRDLDSYFYIGANDDYLDLVIDTESMRSTLLPHSTKILGPVYLDQYLRYSPKGEYLEQDAKLDAFRDSNHSKKIVAFYGIESTTFPIQDILRFLSDHNECAAVFMGEDAYELWTADVPYSLIDRLCMINKMELEELTKVVDVLVTNPDATCITIGMAAGIPQICAWDQEDNFKVRDEWKTNNLCVSRELKLGPSFIVNHTAVPFTMAMGDLMANWDLYVENVKRVQYQVKNEHSAMKAKMSEFFEELSCSAELQILVRQEGIPVRFLLQ
jgi:hypothetical protein